MRLSSLINTSTAAAEKYFKFNDGTVTAQTKIKECGHIHFLVSSTAYSKWVMHTYSILNWATRYAPAII